jgi:hypothetical protein
MLAGSSPFITRGESLFQSPSCRNGYTSRMHTLGVKLIDEARLRFLQLRLEVNAL